MHPNLAVSHRYRRTAFKKCSVNFCNYIRFRVRAPFEYSWEGRFYFSKSRISRFYRPMTMIRVSIWTHFFSSKRRWYKRTQNINMTSERDVMTSFFSPSINYKCISAFSSVNIDKKSWLTSRCEPVTSSELSIPSVPISVNIYVFADLYGI